MFIYRFVARNCATFDFISTERSCEILRVMNSPKRKPNLCLQQIWQPKRDCLMAGRLKTLIIDRKNVPSAPGA